MKNGEPCKHNALKGQRYCGTRSHQEQGAVVAASAPLAPARTHAQEGGKELEFSPHFQEIIQMCKDTLGKPHEKSGMLAQWARIQLDAVRHAMEDLRLRDGLGADTMHIINVNYPSGAKPKAPVRDEATGADDGDAEKVMN